MWPGLVFSTHICFFSRPVCLGYYEKSRDIWVFWSGKLISNFNVFNNIKITLHYSVYAHIRWESTHIRWSRTSSIGFIFSYKIIVRVIYSGVFKGRQARHSPRAPFATVWSTLLSKGPNSNCNVLVGFFAFKGAPNSSCNVYLAFKGAESNYNA